VRSLTAEPVLDARARPGAADLTEVGRALDRAERLRSSLAQLLTAVGMNLEFSEFTGRAVEIVRDAVDADGVFLHLWDSERQTLVLTAATEGVAKGYLHRIEAQLGQGLNGLAALRQQPVVVNAAPADDPHFRSFPELNEGDYQSTAKLPLFRADRTLVGVLSLNARTPGRFGDSHLAVATELAGLFAGLIDSASTGGAVARRARMLDTLTELTASLASAGPAYEVLGSVTNAAVSAMDADLSVLVLPDPETGELAVRSVAPFRSDVLDELAALGVRPGMSAPHAEARSSQLQGYLKGDLVDRFGFMESASLAPGDDSAGFLACYRRRRFCSEDLHLLSVMAHHVGLALMDPSTRWDGRDQSCRVVFERLARGVFDDETASLASGMGLDPAKPLVLLRGRLAASATPRRDASPPDISRAVESVMSMIVSFYPGSLTYVALNQIYGLVEVADSDGDRRLLKRLGELSDRAGQRGVVLEAGVSGVVPHAVDIPRAFRESNDALVIGAKVGGSRVNHYEDLAGSMHLYRVAVDPAFDHDPTVSQLLHLLEHDRRRGTRLLPTLDVYLSSRGNGSHAAEVLGIHRNTLRQRLERITAITGLDLDSADDWLPLQLAVRIVAIRRSAAQS